MSSGVKVDPECGVQFELLKGKSKYAYILFRLADDHKSIIVDKCVDVGATHDDLLQELLVTYKDQCRYVALDLAFQFNGMDKKKILFISWAPENAKTKPKMVHTASKDYLKKALQLVIEVQATDADEVSLETCIEKASRGIKD